MHPSDADIAADVCYRCGYDLRATPDDRPCPECGLLAARSRRESDELRHSRPKWVWSLAGGAVLIIVSIVLAIGATFAPGVLEDQMNSHPTLAMRLWVGSFAAIVGIFFAGVWLLSRPEGYPPADQADRRGRMRLRIAALAPVTAAALAMAYVQESLGPYGVFHDTAFGKWLLAAGVLAGTVGAAPLPILLFLHLRGLAKRARTAQLAEDCLIVGIGVAVLLLAVPIIVGLQMLGIKFFDDLPYMVSLLLQATLLATAILLILWSSALFLRFTWRFIAAARAIRLA